MLLTNIKYLMYIYNTYPISKGGLLNIVIIAANIIIIKNDNLLSLSTSLSNIPFLVYAFLEFMTILV
jgi:hypothetical protein